MAEKLTKAERREIAREKARQLQAEQEKREKRNRMLMIGGAVALVLVVALTAWAIVSNANKSVFDGVTAPTSADSRGGIPVGESLKAGTVNKGAPEVSVYLDYTCHWCAEFEEINGEDLEAMAAEGLITLRIHPVSLLTPAATTFPSMAANAVATVAEYSPEHFLALNRALFEAFYTVYKKYQETGDVADYVLPTLEEIEQMALDAGVPQDVVDRFADDEFADWVAASTTKFKADGYQGTPAVIVDGTQLVNEWQTPGAIREMIEGK